MRILARHVVLDCICRGKGPQDRSGFVLCRLFAVTVRGRVCEHVLHTLHLHIKFISEHLDQSASRTLGRPAQPSGLLRVCNFAGGPFSTQVEHQIAEAFSRTRASAGADDEKVAVVAVHVGMSEADALWELGIPRLWSRPSAGRSAA